MELEKFEKLLNVKITEDWHSDAALQIYTQTSADGYEFYVITNNENDIDWENDLYYYEPNFDDIINRIKDIETYDDDTTIIYCSDIDTFFPEYEVNDYIEQYENDEEE